MLCAAADITLDAVTIAKLAQKLRMSMWALIVVSLISSAVAAAWKVTMPGLPQSGPGGRTLAGWRKYCDRRHGNVAVC